MTTYEFPSTEFACLVDYNAMTEDVLLRDDAEGIINFCKEHKDAVIMCCLDADRIPSIPVDDNIPDDSYWYNFLFNKETETEVDFYNHHAEFNYYPFKMVSSMSTPISYYKSLEISYDYEAYCDYMEQELETVEQQPAPFDFTMTLNPRTDLCCLLEYRAFADGNYIPMIYTPDDAYQVLSENPDSVKLFADPDYWIYPVITDSNYDDQDLDLRKSDWYREASQIINPYECDTEDPRF